MRVPRLSEAWSVTGPIWAASRISVILAGYFAVLLVGFPVPSGPRASENVLLNLPARWDAFWYLDIAVNGYRWRDAPDKQQNVAFFPAFPLAMRAAGGVLGAWRPGIRPPARSIRVLWAGWLLAVGAFWYALVYVYRWSDARAGPVVARSTVMLLAAYPFAVFFSAPYTESLFLLGVTAVFVHFERTEWLRAAAWGFVVGFARPNGMLLTIPLALIAVQSARGVRPLFRRGAAIWIALAAPAAGVVVYSLFMWHLTGRFLAWTEVQAAWGRTYQVTAWMGEGLSELAGRGVFEYTEGAPTTVLNGLAAALALALLWPVGRVAGIPYVVFVIVNLLPAVASGGLMSVGRFTSTLFPLFFALATLVPHRQLTAWLVALAVLQGLMAVLFFTWRPPV
jgi:hypothetical protein